MPCKILATLACAFATAAAFQPSSGRRAAALTRTHFLSPEMSGAIAKFTDGENYEAIVSETMRKEDCSREEAEDRYNQFLFDPDGYSILKMNEQLRDEGYATFEEKFVAENGQDAWDKRQADAAAAKEARGNNSLIIVGVLFTAFAVAQNAGVV